MEERNESGVVIEREMQLLHEWERVPSSYARWLESAQREMGVGVSLVDLDACFERVGDGRFKCRMVRAVTGEVCDVGPFTKGAVGHHFCQCHVLSVYRTRCAICSASVSCASDLRAHLRRCHSSLFTSTAVGSTWKSVYAECVRETMEREGASESEIESEILKLYELERVPAGFHRWAKQ